MVLWRISRHRDLRGIGGLKVSGRWHDAGQPVVYLSESAASALLEVCVHTAANDIPPTYILLRVEGPKRAGIVSKLGELPANWSEQQEITREIGTAWLREKKTVLLEVPSAIIPHTKNYLFNPLHPDAEKFQITEVLEYPFDVRIKG